MALIIYPNTGYDTFITTVDATVVIQKYTLQSAAWIALSVDDQESYLRIAFRNIVDNTPDFPDGVDPVDDCVGDAQALIASQDVTYGISASTTVGDVGAVKKQKVASVEVEYYDPGTGVTETAPTIPEMAWSCLESIGYVRPSGVSGLTQSTLGRS